jgi:hypothetical protein
MVSPESTNNVSPFVHKQIDLKQMLKLPSIASTGPDRNVPGCFGGKNFHSPRSVLRKDSVRNLLKDKF